MSRRRLFAVLIVYGVLAASMPRLAKTPTQSALSQPKLTPEELALVGVWRHEPHYTEGEHLMEFRADRSMANTGWAGPGRSGEKSVETCGWSVRDGMLVVHSDASDLDFLVLAYNTPRLQRPADPKALAKSVLAIAYVTADNLTMEGCGGVRHVYTRVSSRQP